MIDKKMFEFDKSNMYLKLTEFHKQLIVGLKIGTESNLLGLPGQSFKSIVFAGMGGSAIAGDLLQGILGHKLKIPMTVRRNYGLPDHVNHDALVICSSYSGNTEETLSVFNEAIKKQLSILCITTGGELARQADEFNIPVVKIPTGYMPREAIGLSLTPLLVVFNRLGLGDDPNQDIIEAADTLKQLSNKLQDKADNYAFNLARKLSGKIVVIYSDSGLPGSLGLRLKCQICENAKQLAFNNLFPEFNHNELVGWELSSQHKDNLAVVVIKDQQMTPQISGRIKAVKEILAEKNVDVIEIEIAGKSTFEKAMATISITDFVSYYLSLINGIDPTPIKLIDYLKEKMAAIKEKS